MAQSDQVVQNATFPSVRADINDNLAALFTQSSGNSAPSVTVAFQPWVDTSSSPPVWKVRNGSNTAWITIGVLDPAGFNAGGITAIANGGTGNTTAAAALAALLPSQGGNAGKALVTSGSLASWGVVASGASIQVFTSNGTYTPTAGKTTFLVFATGGGAGAGKGGSIYQGTVGGGGGGGGTAFRLYNTTETGSTASVTIGAGGAAATATYTAGSSGGNTTFNPSGTGLAITGNGGSGGSSGTEGGDGGGATNSLVRLNGMRGNNGAPEVGVAVGGATFFSSKGSGGTGFDGVVGDTGSNGMIMILEW
jgi:hypothetical protein